MPYESRALKENPLGDPFVRDIALYRPPSGRTEGKPLLLLLTGFTGAGWMHFPHRNRYLSETFPQVIERLQRTGACPEAVVVAPDGMSMLGGSQYLNSTATGAYEDYIVEDIVPWAKERYRTGAVGVLGHSSGGYGALVLPLRHPRIFSALLASAPDSQFEYCYQPDFPKAVRVLKERGGPTRFLEWLFTTPPAIGSASPVGATLNTLAMASCYSPTIGVPGAFDLPFAPETGAIDETVWRRWLAWDPVRMIRNEGMAGVVRGMRSIQVGGGLSDEWFLDVGAHRFAEEVRALGGTVREEYPPGTHGDVWPILLERFLPDMVRALGGE